MKKVDNSAWTYFLFLRLGITIILMLTISIQSWSQGWEKLYPDSIDIELGEIIVRPDSGYTVVNYQRYVFANGSADFDISINETQIFSTDQYGNLLWLNQELDSMAATNIFQSLDGGYFVIGTDWNPTNGTAGFQVAKLDAQGQLSWEKSFTPNLDYDRFWAWEGLVLPDSSFLVGGQSRDYDRVNESYAFLMKLDQNGNQIWYREFDAAEEISYITDIYPSNSGGFLLTGFKGSDQITVIDTTPTIQYRHVINQPFCLASIDSEGNFLWSTTWSNAGLWQATTMLEDGNILYVSYDTIKKKETSGNWLWSDADTLRLSKVDQQGNQLWEKLVSVAGYDPGGYSYFVTHITSTIDTGAIFILRDGGLSESNIFKLDKNGEIEWHKRFGHDTGDISTTRLSWLNDVEQTLDDGYILCGWYMPDTTTGRLAYLVKINEDGSLYDTQISGNIYHDENANCELDSLEPGSGSGWIIKATDGILSWYGATDSSGYYDIEVPASTLEVGVDNLQFNPYVSYCPATVQVSFSGNDQNVFVDFGSHIDIYCPLLNVSMNSWRMRRCSENQYIGNVCNIGTDTAFDATLEVLLDPWLTFDSSDLSLLSQNGQQIVFDLGDVEPGECVDFKIFFFLDCDAPPGLAHCSEAHAYPDSLCLPPSPIWDASSVVVSGECMNEDTIHFNILNDGQGDMQQSNDLIVIEDHMIMLTDQFQLIAGGDEDINLAATGATYRLEADQSPGHPGQSYPSVTVEGCGFGQGLVISTGFVNMFPQDDADYWVDIDCRENTASFDPNQKEAFPEGFMEDHAIERNTDIEYLIQFQNTGTDTAFYVAIRDTLSLFLTPGSIRLGASSHPYEFDMVGEGIVEFTFPDIILPDSNVNEPMSHGFVSFRISQQPDIPWGSVIYNSAAIYFDFNEPIITNETFHTVDTNFIEIINDVTELPEGFGKLLANPNPSSSEVTFEIPSALPVHAVFVLYDQVGRQVIKEKFIGQQFTFTRGRLPAGIYFYKVEISGEGVYSGKVVLK